MHIFIFIPIIQGILYIHAAPTSRRPSLLTSSTTVTVIEDSDSDDGEPTLLEILKRRLENLDYSMLSSLDILLNEERSKHTATGVATRALDIFNKRKVPESSRSRMHDEAAIAFAKLLTGDSRIAETSNSTSTDDQQARLTSDDDYCEESSVPGLDRRVSIDTMTKIVELKESGKSEKQIQNRYRWYRRQYYERFKRRIEAGSVTRYKMEDINQYVADKVISARRNLRPLHGYMLRRWALERAEEIGADFFRASHTWLWKWKKNRGIVSRKVTEYCDRERYTEQCLIDDRIDQFLTEFSDHERFFNRRRIWNFDQSGFNYEISNERTLSWRGERDTRLSVGSQNKRTHSYTVQPLISRDGKTIGKLLICLQETGGRFGPQVERSVRGYEERFGNIVVVASQSGKMDKRLVEEWARRVVRPAIRGTIQPSDTDTDIASSLESLSMDDENEEVFDDGIHDRERNASYLCHSRSRRRIERRCRVASCSQEDMSARDNRAFDRCYRRPHTLILADSWAGHSGADNADRMRALGARLLIIPKKTTDEIQPLDVTIFRQYKKFFKRIVEEAIFNEQLQYVTSREGILNLHSLIWNQFGSEAYTDMIRWAWRNTDPTWARVELRDPDRPSPRMVEEIQFELHESTCGHPECNNRAFIKCSHCGKLMCIRHFIERTCFHSRGHDVRAGPSGAGQQRNDSGSDHLIDDDLDDDLDLNLMRQSTPPTTSRSSQASMRPTFAPIAQVQRSTTFQPARDELRA